MAAMVELGGFEPPSSVHSLQCSAGTYYPLRVARRSVRRRHHCSPVLHTVRLPNPTRPCSTRWVEEMHIAVSLILSRVPSARGSTTYSRTHAPCTLTECLADERLARICQRENLTRHSVFCRCQGPQAPATG
jgi:hypothetical protein